MREGGAQTAPLHAMSEPTKKPRGTLPGRVKAPEDKLSPAGRPRREPPCDALEIITEAAAHGATKKGAAFALGVTMDVFNRWIAERPELLEAFEKGREREPQFLHDALYQTAVNGTGKDKLIAAMFLLKARHGYIEGEKPQETSRVNVTFNIPAAQPLDKFMVIENEPNH